MSMGNSANSNYNASKLPVYSKSSKVSHSTFLKQEIKARIEQLRDLHDENIDIIEYLDKLKEIALKEKSKIVVTPGYINEECKYDIAPYVGPTEFQKIEPKKIFTNEIKSIKNEIPAPVYTSHKNFFQITSGNDEIKDDNIVSIPDISITPQTAMVHAIKIFKENPKNNNSKLCSLKTIEKIEPKKEIIIDSNINTNVNEGFDEDEETKNNDTSEMQYKLSLDLDHSTEMKDPKAFEKSIKEEIAVALNVNIEDIIINSIEAGSINIEITIRDPAGKYTEKLVQNFSDYKLTQNEFSNWTINQCIDGRDMSTYFKKTPIQTFDANTLMWKSFAVHFSNSYESMVSESKAKVNELKTKYPKLSFDQIAAIYLYTTNFLYSQLSSELYSHKTKKFADYICVLISGLAKLPLIWKKTYRGMSTRYVTQNPKLFENYAEGTVFRWDGMSSTSMKKSVAEGFGTSGYCFEIEQGFHGRDVKPFSQFAGEEEILYSLSTHFLITKKYAENGKIWFKIMELSFPWSATAILWVDDKPENNKSLITEVESMGIMVVPKVSTKQAIDFLDFMKAILCGNMREFRIISDMNRDEKVNEYEDGSPTKLITNAGAILVKELRKKNYMQKVLIFTSNKEQAVQKCQAIGVDTNSNDLIITTSSLECSAFSQFR